MLNTKELKVIQAGAIPHLQKAPGPLRAMWGSLVKKVEELLAYYVPREKQYLDAERIQAETKKLIENNGVEMTKREIALKKDKDNVEAIRSSLEGRESAVRQSQAQAASDRATLDGQKMTQDERERTLRDMDARLTVRAEEQAEMDRTQAGVTEVQLAKTQELDQREQALESDRMKQNKEHADRMAKLDEREAEIEPRMNAVKQAEQANLAERNKLTQDVVAFQDDKRAFEKTKKEFYDRNVDVQGILDEDAREQKEIDRLRVEADAREAARQDRLRQLPGGARDMQS